MLAVGLVLGGSVAGFAGIRPDTRLIAAHGALDQIGVEIELVSRVLDGLEDRVASVGTELSDLHDVLAAADTQLLERRRELDRRSALSMEIVTAGHLPGRPEVPTSLADLRAPLRIVSRAIHANDELATELLDQQGEGGRGVVEARELLAGLRQTMFQLQTQERLVRAELIEAIRSSATIAEAAADPAIALEADRLIASARRELHRIDLAQGEIRASEAEVLEQSVQFQERLTQIQGGMREVRRTTKDLYAEMAIAELLVSSRLSGWRGQAFGDLTIALDGVLRVCPVDEPRAYSDNWHAPRWGGGFHLHQGIDIFAPEGTAIRAPFDGTAVTADNWLGGLAVKVYGESGYVYNAHLSAHGLLGPVQAGDIIGYVGSTGNASGPHDHFEYHPGNGDAVNPYLFLNAVC